MKKFVMVIGLMLALVSGVFAQTAPTTVQPDKAAYDRGKAAYDQDNYDKAIMELTEAIRLNPNNGSAYFYRADSYAMKEDYDRALPDINQAIRLSPNNSEYFYLRGVVYFWKDDYDRAIEDFNQALKIDPNKEKAKRDLEITHQRKQNSSSQPTAAPLQPDKAAYDRGREAYGQKNYDKAITEFTEAIRLNPNYELAYYYRAEAYTMKEDYDKALVDFTQAIRLSPNDTDNYNERGYVYILKKDYDRAIADFNQTLKLDPNNADAKEGLEEVQKRKQNSSSQPTTVQPDEAAFERGMAAYEQRNYDKAITEFTEVIRLNPNYELAYHFRARAYTMRQDYDKALADSNQAIRLNPNDDYNYSVRGFAYLLKKDYDRAIADFNHALKLNPDNTNAKEGLELIRQVKQNSAPADAPPTTSPVNGGQKIILVKLENNPLYNDGKPLTDKDIEMGKGWIVGDQFKMVMDAKPGSFIRLTCSGTANLNWDTIGAVGVKSMKNEQKRINFKAKKGGTYIIDIDIAKLLAKIKGENEAISVNIWGGHVINKVELYLY